MARVWEWKIRALVPPPWRQRRRGRVRVELERELGWSLGVMMDVGNERRRAMTVEVSEWILTIDDCNDGSLHGGL